MLPSSLGIRVFSLCAKRNHYQETTDHLIRDCPALPTFGHQFLFIHPTSTPSTLIFMHGFSVTVPLCIAHPRIPWSSLFRSILWNIWNDRNSPCFQ
ncbi:hypothetical protein SLE2022_312030 [Rubroshorea leprosula]